MKSKAYLSPILGIAKSKLSLDTHIKNLWISYVATDKEI